ncbi:hypothetical protein [Glaciibacter sp. 2TAF33]|uniref:hypothetical protein n=1 Tax=Glaciibacter sp. 2TAF33 TaxID=3233015 RepID=UPI003F907074
MIAGRVQPSEPNHIRIDALSASEWRVSDDRVPSNDASSLVGFIEEHDGVYEVLRFGDPVEFTFAPSLDAAIAHLTDAVGRSATGTGLHLATVTQIVRTKAAS